MDNAKTMYSRAYELQYKKKDYILAYNLYKQIIEKYPEMDEAKYAENQIKNIEHIPDFDISFANDIKDDAAEYKTDDEIRQENLKNMIITSGYNFEGYAIIKYIKFISSEVVLGMGIFKGVAASLSNLFGTESIAFKEKLSEAKDVVNKDIAKQASNIGANAIIGVDLDYTMFGGELLGVVMSGTAVIIEKSKIEWFINALI